jgi:hypothetical protein
LFREAKTTETCDEMINSQAETKPHSKGKKNKHHHHNKHTSPPALAKGGQNNEKNLPSEDEKKKKEDDNIEIVNIEIDIIRSIYMVSSLRFS